VSLELAAAYPCHSAATKGEDKRARIQHGLTKPKATPQDVCGEELALQSLLFKQAGSPRFISLNEICPLEKMLLRKPISKTIPQN